MTHSLHTRVADDGDRAAIRALYEQALRGHIETIWGWDPAWQQANFDQAYTSMATLVVEQDGAMRGYIQLNLQAPEVYLSMLVLSPELRSQGIGAALLRALLQRTHAAGRDMRLRVFKVNQAAQRFYAREGWLAESSDEVAIFMRPPPAAALGDDAAALGAEDFAMALPA